MTASWLPPGDTEFAAVVVGASHFPQMAQNSPS